MPPECDRRERSRPRSVSVVAPAYNATTTLSEPLEALGAQQYEDDWEVVIVDNGSTQRHRGPGPAGPMHFAGSRLVE
jgi:cellulose synthase/poly-beta-1,6-N-acetylglucosamine synthase-like glycosyltransferase